MTPQMDNRSLDQRTRDEKIAAESELPPLDLAPGAASSPMETYAARRGGHPGGRRRSRRERLGAALRPHRKISGTIARHYRRIGGDLIWDVILLPLSPPE